MKAQSTILEHYKKQSEDLKVISDRSGLSVLTVLQLKNKYAKRSLDIYYLGMYAEKYKDGTAEKAKSRAFERKAYYLSKIINLEKITN